MKLVCVIALLCLSTVANAALTSEITAAAQQASNSASSYVFNPVATANSTNLATSVGGSSSPRMLAQFPALAGLGISQTYFVMNGCALRPAHIHPRASGLLYAISAANLSVGFISESGQLYQNYVSSGASAIFPQGLVHYQANADCNPAVYTISYSSEDPGTQVIPSAYETLPAAVAAAGLGLNVTGYQALQADLPKPAFVPNSDPACVAACQAANINVLAPAPIMDFTTSAGKR